MDNDIEGHDKAIGNGTSIIAPISRPAAIWDIFREAFATPWRAAVIIAAMIIIIATSIFVWAQIIGPALFPPLQSELIASVSYDDKSAGLAPSLEKPFRCSPNFPFKNNVSQQVEHECKQ